MGSDTVRQALTTCYLVKIYVLFVYCLCNKTFKACNSCLRQGCGSSRIFFASASCSMCVSHFKFASASSFFLQVFSLPLPQKFNRFRFHTPAPYLMKNASDSGSSKSQMFSSLLPLSVSFFKVLLLPLPQKFNRFQSPLSLSYPWFKVKIL